MSEQIDTRKNPPEAAGAAGRTLRVESEVPPGVTLTPTTSLPAASATANLPFPSAAKPYGFELSSAPSGLYAASYAPKSARLVTDAGK